MNRFSFIVSDESINKYGYRVLSNGIDITEFKKNPVMFWNHLRGDDGTEADRMPIGKWEDLRIEDGKLMADAVLDMNDEQGRKIAGKLKDGFLNAASIGIGVLDMSDKSDLIHAGQTRPTITKSVLQEISIVDIPANSNAMRLSFQGISLNLSAGMDLQKLNSIMPEIKLGAVIGGNLDRLVDAYAEANEMTKSEALDAYGNAAGISGDTVGNIINGNIDCPPLARLEGFANISEIALDTWLEWASADGCEMNDEGEEEEMENATDEAAAEMEALRGVIAALSAKVENIVIPEIKDYTPELEALRGDLETFKQEGEAMKTELSAANETIESLRGELLVLKGAGTDAGTTDDKPVLGFGGKSDDSMKSAFAAFGKMANNQTRIKKDFQ